MKDNLYDYLVATDSLDEFLHYEPKCPKCKSKLIEIIYGRPDSKLIEQAKRDEIILGGCIINGEIPSYHCNQCQTDYTKNLKEYHGKDNEK